jgi:hypothetical protein
MSGQCPLGNRGFPIIVAGLDSSRKLSNTDGTTQTPNDIKLQFMKTTISKPQPFIGNYDVAGSQSFFLGGTQYSLYCMRICKSFDNGVTYGQNLLIELHFWGRSKNGNIGVLIIPFVKSTANSNEFTNLINLINNNSRNDLSSIFPQQAEVIRYSTCVEYISGADITNKTIAVAYWRNGIEVNDNTSISYTYGIPVGLNSNLNAVNTLSEVGATAERTVSYVENWHLDNPTQSSVTRSYTSTIQYTSSDFRNRFRYCIFTIASTQEAAGQKDYKCIAIDRQKDVVNGRIMVDPATGKSLKDSLEEDNAAQASLNVIPPSVTTNGDVERTASIIVGVIGGTILLGIAVFTIRWFITSKTPAQIEAAAAAAALLSRSPTIEWTDLLLPVFLGTIFTLTLVVAIVMFIYVKPINIGV